MGDRDHPHYILLVEIDNREGKMLQDKTASAV